MIARGKRSLLRPLAAGFRQARAQLKSKITVEPVLACYIIPIVLAGLATQNLNLEKACRVNLRYNDTVCDALSSRSVDNFTVEERNTQVLVAGMLSWKTALACAIPALMIIFLGSWSDRRARRKPCLIMPLVGEVLKSGGLLLCTYFFLEWSMEIVGVVECLFPAVTGGGLLMFLGAFSYLADVTTADERTFRIGVGSTFVFLGVPIGTALSGILYNTTGYYGVFSICGVLYIFSLLYAYFGIAEPRPSVARPAGISCCEDFFHFDHVIDTVSVAFKSREDHRRTSILLLMVLSVIVTGPGAGESAVGYLFARYKFQWNEVYFSAFATFATIIHLIGLMIISLLSRFLSLSDSMIGLIGCISKIFANFIFAFTNDAWLFYVGVLVEMLAGGSHVAMRAMTSKVVPSDELGKLNSLVGISEAVTPMVYAPAYSALYAATISSMPGAYFLLGSVLTVPSALIFTILYRFEKEQALSNSSKTEGKETAAEIEKSTIQTLSNTFTLEGLEKDPGIHNVKV